MARGKRLSHEDKIAKLIKKMEEISDKKKLMIATYDEQLKQLQNEAKELHAQEKADRIGGLSDLMESKGMTIERLFEIIENEPAKAE